MYKILVVSSDFPYPANHGGRKDIWERIKALAKMGYEIDLIATVTEKVDESYISIVKQFCSEITLINRNLTLLNIFSIYPFQYKTRELLKEIAIMKNYDFIICEGDYVLSILENKNLTGKEKLIYRMHNNEVKYLFELMKSDKKVLKKIYYLTESLKNKILTKKYSKDLKNIWFISADEKRVYEEKVHKLNSLFLPPHVNKDSYKFKKTLNNNVLFIGSFFMVNNREGVIWYLENIHDNVSKQVSDYTLTIAGNSKGEGIKWLEETIKECKFRSNISIYDSPKSLDDLYSSCSVFINPMLHGAGVKLKTVEAIQKGLSVVSTSVGAEGTGLIDNEHIYIGKDKFEFSQKLLYILKSNKDKVRLVRNSQLYLKNEFDITKKVIKYLNNLNCNG
ncbi:glycosyltransferase family 4 protein [Bacillus sinesaloumensis]|uniref:glycosyltransferase family 4 protein n=1 Tax=Litchfieldia sinesaloumensis TaxID=1926280 RepID=UPI0009886D80|nr:glycosyltransferase family 4 protein [Bacillus sinesaloumensis]